MIQTNSVHLPAIPSPLRWQGNPEKWCLDDDDALTISAGERTDWFVDPEGAYSVDNAPRLLFAVNEPCSLKARVTVNPASTFDAGALAVYQGEKVWAKLALEYSPQGQLTIVSVITNGISDDCNSGAINGQSVYLRVTRQERSYVFHYSLDGKHWVLVRYFPLGGTQPAEIGFLAQSPLGKGYTVRFSEIEYIVSKLSDIRSGE